jgi:hypothetical protein
MLLLLLVVVVVVVMLLFLFLKMLVAYFYSIFFAFVLDRFKHSILDIKDISQRFLNNDNNSNNNNNNIAHHYLKLCAVGSIFIPGIDAFGCYLLHHLLDECRRVRERDNLSYHCTSHQYTYISVFV